VERKPRKSVAFSDGATIVDADGNVEEMNGVADGEAKSSAESHAAGRSYSADWSSTDDMG
jgi:translation initiation factor 2 subunit 2